MFSMLRCMSRLQNTSCTKIVYRQYMKVSEKMEMLLKKTDHVPRDYNLIYREMSQRLPGIMYHSINFITCTTAVTVGTHLYNGTSGVKEGFPVFVENPFQAVLAGFFVIVFLVMSQTMRKRYPLRIYFNEKKKVFRAIFIGKFPFTTEFYEYPQESARYCHKGSILPWKGSLFEANGRKLYLYDDKFKTQSDFYRMLRPSELLD